MKKNLKFKKSFTLLEVLISISALSIGVVAAFGSLSRAISVASYAKDRLIASYLAQEGIEIVKNIRDRNWIVGNEWTSGLYVGLERQADYYDNISLSQSFNRNSYLSLNTSEGYNYNPTVPLTKFSRKIIVKEISPEELEINVTVFWQNHSFEIKSIITKWLR